MTLAQTLAPQFEDFLSGVTRVMIGTHVNPDGDALGSALGLGMALESRGLLVDILCFHEAPGNLRFLPGVERLRRSPGLQGHEAAIVCDLGSLDRLGGLQPLFEAAPKLAVIDHHVPHETPGQMRIVDTSEPATCCILTDLLEAMGVEITPEIATCLLAGIVTDTGSFRFRNTTPDALAQASRLLEHGGDIVRVGEEVYARRPLTAVRLLGRTIDQMKLDCDNRLAWATISRQDFLDTGADEENTEGLTNELLAIESVQVAAVMREPVGRVVRASLRSREPYDVAAVARQFGGGGHKLAAGCTFESSLEDAEARLIEALRRCLES